MATPGPSTVPLHAYVRVTAGTGVVRFVGQTAFAAGKWIGIELDDEGTGKNDGSVQGKVYFELDKAGTQSGVFVRPSQVHILEVRPTYAEHDGDPDISQDDIQPGGNADDDEVFTAPAPPKLRAASRPSSVASSARSRLISPSPGTPSARRVSSRPLPAGVASTGPSSTRPSPAPSPRPSLSSRPSLATPGARPALRAPGTTSRVSSTSSVASTSSAAPKTLDPRQYGLSSSRGPGAQAPATPRPSVGAGISSTVAEIALSPAAAEPSSAEMQRGVSSSSSRSSIASASLLSRKPLSRTTSLVSQEASPPWQEQNKADGAGAAAEFAEDSPSVSHANSRAAKQSVEEARFSLQPAASGAASEPKQPLTVPARLYEELQLKFKLLENGRAEDRERLKEMERIKEDAEAWNVARPKLQNKMVELSNEVKDLRRQAKDAEGERQGFSKQIEDLNDQLEMEMLDKEVAEEKIEAAEGELEKAKERISELEVELEVLHKEDARIVKEAGQGVEGDSDVKNSLAFLQLAKQNERLKEALVRLRDVTSENEQDYKRRLADLEKELDLTSDLQAAFDSTLEQLEQAEGMVENLKLQLDDAMGAEDMLEHLTERNLTLSERIEEMHAVIQDLEALKELNDELEENHVENEKHMQEEIDIKDYHLREAKKQIDSMEDSMLDYEGTISQFRDLVVNLQNDMELLRDQQQAQQTEKATLSSQSQAMLNLNMKLQTTVVRNQSKAVDFELRKFEAAQAREQLQIVTPYLPAAFIEDDKPAVDALLFFNRLACKTQILLNTLDQTHGLADGSFPDIIPENLVVACETRTRVARLMALAKRFTANLQRCEPQTFVRMGKVYVELLSIEKRIDHFIELAKKQELKEASSGEDIDRFMAQAAHVAELHLGESGLDYGEQHYGQILAIDYHLDTFIAGIGYTKQCLATVVNDADVTVETAGVDMDEEVFVRLQTLIDSARSIKTTSKKLVRRLEEVAESANHVRTEVSESFQGASINMHSVAGFASKLSDSTARYTLEVRTSKDPFLLSTYSGITQEAASDIRSQSKDMTGAEVVLRNVQQALAPALAAALEAENVVKNTYEAPWVARATELHRNAARDEEAEQKVIKLTEDIRDLARELRIKDQAVQESAVKVELLQKRMESGKKQADSAAELEAEVATLREHEREFESIIEQMQQDLEALERENTKLKQAAPAEKNASSMDTGEYTTFTGSLETSHLVEQIESLRGTVRYLRQQNSHIKSKGMFRDFYALPTYDKVVSDDERATKARSLTEESAVLLKQVANLSSRARVVDVSKVDSSKAWQPGERLPAAQLAAKRQTLQKLKARIDKLAEEKRELAAARALPSVVRL